MDMKQQLNTLKEEIRMKGTEIDTLGTQLNGNFTTLQEEIRKKGKEIDSLRTQLNKITTAAASHVPKTFHAYLSTDVTLSDHEIIKFDIEETDTVNSYDTTNGMFTAHVDRFYFLAITIHSAVNSYVGAEIVVNGVVKGEAFADSEEIADTHSSSAMTIVRMSAREEAYVRRGSDSKSALWSQATRGRSTFSGWLLN
ncbi:complement C1q-like protein 2 isoform X1 [Mya arenaria]|uniref:complement C1q-like protein 2 isoform X1 n=2 Tax=Mya arenaria TaxID=6604 RepID=UPI0022E22515|nr:complement C1q-like protein 2 isoform X1 [Mya arenaria]